MHRTEHARLDRLNGIGLIVKRRCRTGKVINFVDFHIERKADVVANDLEMRVGAQMKNILPVASKKIIDADDLVPFFQQTFAQMRA